MGPVKLASIEATLIKVDGGIEEVKPTDGNFFGLIELREHIGCEFIELVRLIGNDMADDGEAEEMPLPTLDMIVDENGKLDGRPTNAIATQIWRQYYPFSLDVMVGNVIILKPQYMER